MTSNQTVRRARLAAEQEFRRTEQAVVEQAEDYRPAAQPTSERRAYADGYTRYNRPGQCTACGAWRVDGQPPTVHRTDCVEGPDGSQLPAVRDTPTARPTVKATLTPGTGSRPGSQRRNPDDRPR